MKKVLSCIAGALVAVACAGLVSAAEHTVKKSAPVTAARPIKQAKKVKKTTKANAQVKENGHLNAGPQTFPAPPHAPANQ